MTFFINNGLMLSERPSPPSSKEYKIYQLGDDWQGEKTKHNIPLSWHHICPFNFLRRIWNNIIMLQNFNLLKTYIISIDKNHILSSDDKNNIISKVQASSLVGDICDNLAAVICWIPPNLVKGPAGEYRAHDPGDNVDIFSNIKCIQELSNNDRKKIFNFEQIANLALTLGRYENTDVLVEISANACVSYKTLILNIIDLIKEVSLNPISYKGIWIEGDNYKWHVNR